MSARAKKRGLGRGLDALFAEQAPIMEEIDNAEEEKAAKGSSSSKAGAKRKSASGGASKSAGRKGASGSASKSAGRAAAKTEAEDLDVAGSVIYIDINDIKPNRAQPRQDFDEEKIAELADSITEHGIIQPLVVRQSGKTYELVAGERRWRAARKAELPKVPCIVREFTDEENMLVAIIENMQREDLNPIEEAQGLNEMIKAYGLTQEQVSRSVSKSRPYITNSLRLLKLPDSIQEKVRAGELSTGHARALLSIKSKKQQEELCGRIIREGMSVREIEKLAASEKKPRKKPLKRVKSADTLSVEEELKSLYGTRVSINQKGNRGAIEIEFYSSEELNRIIDLLRK